MSPSALGLFHRAIPMSASPNISVPLVFVSIKLKFKIKSVAEEMHKVDWLEQTLCVKNASVECLYELNSDQVLDAVTEAWNPEFLFG
jgi:carboxylesterase type B